MVFDPRKAPFNLSEEKAAWVDRIMGELTLDQKLAQLLNLFIRSNDPDDLRRMQNIGAGSIALALAGSAASQRELRTQFHESAPVPLLVTADLEGGRMTPAGGVDLPNPLGLAAIDDIEATKRATQIMAHDGLANGINWSFTPLLDINAAFRSAIVGTRSFGSDPEIIRRHMLAQIETLQGAGIAATAKHWPGEGYDDRDQHLVTTVNPLTVEEWEERFGSLYRSAFDAGVLSVMPGHIALPSWCRAIGAEDDVFKPATINRHITQRLLRDHLGFNGIVVSDASAMAGIGAYAPRRDYAAQIISEGCDIILLSSNPEQDLAYLKDALAEGTLSEARVDDAVMRQLALKAWAGLDSQSHAPELPRDRKADEEFALDLHSRVPTLVKDTQNLFPISPDKHKRVLVISGGIVWPFAPHPLPFALPDMMKAKGFDVTVYQPGDPVVPQDFDLVLYLFGEETVLTRNNIFIDWHKLMGGFTHSMERYWHDVPTAILSFGYPYHLYDAPRVPTYVNAYATTERMQEAVLAAMLGEAKWLGKSPVDPFCGLEDARM